MDTPRTSLGYYSFSKKNLQNLFGYKYKGVDLSDINTQSLIKRVLHRHEKDEIDINPDTIDNPAWKEFPHDTFEIYNHNRPSIKKFLKEVTTEQVGWMSELLRQYYTSTNPIAGIMKPSHFVIHPGWVCYPHVDYSKPILNTPPQELIYVLDTETFVQHTVTEYGLRRFAPPVIATATSDAAHYIWLHPQLIEGEGVPEGEKMRIELVPLKEHKSIVLYWNSAYDVPRVLNSYDYNSKVHAIDLMSLHITRHGYSSEQRAIKGKLIKEGAKRLPLWARVGSENSLIAAYNFYLANTKTRLKLEDKQIRNFFVDMKSLSELSDNLSDMLFYAHKDSQYTYQLSKPVLQDYLTAQGCLVSLACHSDLALSKFQVDPQEWEEFFQFSESYYHELIEEQQKIFDNIAQGILDSYDNDLISEEEIESDLYYRNWDWRSQGKIRKIERKYYEALDPLGNVIQSGILLPEKTRVKDYLAELQIFSPGITKLKLVQKEIEEVETEGYGVPRWVYPLVKEGTLGLTNKSVLAHELLRLKFKGESVIYSSEDKYTTVSGEKLPHKKGVGLNVGCVLSKDFIPLFEEGKISSDGYQKELERVFQISKLIAYWTSARSRVAEYHHHNGTMMCNFIPNQTISQRGASKLFSTIPDPKIDKIGSDVKNLMHPRKGYTLVGLDFSGQELAIFALLGSSVFGLENSTSLSHAILVGDKLRNTDFHSLTAKSSEVSRKTGKIINFLIQYGGEEKALTNTIATGNRDLPLIECKNKAKKAIYYIKGIKQYNDSKSFKYKDGIGSHCFNKNAEIAGQLIQKFLVTGTTFPKTMQVVNTGDDFVLTRNNLVIQSCGRALLEVVLSLTKYWAGKINLPLHLVCTIHDAILYEVPKSRYRELCAILQMAHIYCWAMLRYELGIPEMGLSGAFFESFEIGNFLRKSYDAETVTPYNKENYPDHILLTQWDTFPDMIKMFRGGDIRSLFFN